MSRSNCTGCKEQTIPAAGKWPAKDDLTTTIVPPQRCRVWQHRANYSMLCGSDNPAKFDDLTSPKRVNAAALPNVIENGENVLWEITAQMAKTATY